MFYTQDKVEEIKTEMKTEPVIYSWSTVTCMGGDAFKLVRFLLSLSGILGPLIMYLIILISDPENVTTSIDVAFLIGGLLFFLFARYLIFTDQCYEFYLTKKGIYGSYYQMISDSSYFVIRIIAGIGALVCLFAVVLVGPLAFFGVGGFALLSFTKLNFNKEIYDIDSVFQPDMFLFDIENNNLLIIDSNPHLPSGKLKLYCDFKEKKIIKEYIINTIEGCELFHAKDEHEYDKHPKRKETLEEWYKVRDIYENKSN